MYYIIYCSIVHIPIFKRVEIDVVSIVEIDQFNLTDFDQIKTVANTKAPLMGLNQISI